MLEGIMYIADVSTAWKAQTKNSKSFRLTFVTALLLSLLTITFTNASRTAE